MLNNMLNNHPAPEKTHSNIFPTKTATGGIEENKRVGESLFNKVAGISKRDCNTGVFL